MKEKGNEWQDQLLWMSQAHRVGFLGGSVDKLDYFVRMRVRILSGIMILLLSIVGARLIYLQVLEGDRQLLFAETNHLEILHVPASRGSILDAQGMALVNNVQIAGENEKPTRISRKYLLSEAASSVVGYISQVTEAEVGCQEGRCYRPGQMIGRAGVEKLEEAKLRGKDGEKLVEISASGQVVRELGETVPEVGENVKLTIDSRLQTIMYEALQGKMGAAVALDLSGRVLGIVSSPSFDPNLFTTETDPIRLNTLLQDEEKQYFLNRATMGVYPPGSVFKLVTAVAGLMSGAIDKETLIEDTGEIRVDEYRYGNWYFDQYGRKEGKINVVTALARSNDIFFYRVGELMGVDTLVSWAKKFGFGEATGIELPERVGVLPNKLWKEQTSGEKWFLGNTYHLSIGQGDLLATPLQVARMTAGVITGRLCKVSILDGKGVECTDLGVSSDVLAVVKEGMKGVCATGGTAFPFFNFEPYVLCKTGTAQHAGQKNDEDKPHAWVTVAYPGENPTMVLSVVLPAAGEGSYEAAPVAKEILTKWKKLGD